jgi:hypothetical protein
MYGHFSKPLTDRIDLGCEELRRGREKVHMDGISWTDLDAQEQDALENLREGFSTVSCDPVAVLTLQRIGLLKAAELTPEAEKLLTQATSVNEILLSSWFC